MKRKAIGLLIGLVLGVGSVGAVAKVTGVQIDVSSLQEQLESFMDMISEIDPQRISVSNQMKEVKVGLLTFLVFLIKPSKKNIFKEKGRIAGQGRDFDVTFNNIIELEE